MGNPPARNGTTGNAGLLNTFCLNCYELRINTYLRQTGSVWLTLVGYYDM